MHQILLNTNLTGITLFKNAVIVELVIFIGNLLPAVAAEKIFNSGRTLKSQLQALCDLNSVDEQQYTLHLCINVANTLNFPLLQQVINLI